jgi:hypothetical protein
VNATILEALKLDTEERATMGELLEEARTKLLVEIRRTDHRQFRDELRQRLSVIERLLERCRMN